VIRGHQRKGYRSLIPTMLSIARFEARMIPSTGIVDAKDDSARRLLERESFCHPRPADEAVSADGGFKRLSNRNDGGELAGALATERRGGADEPFE